MNTSTSLAQQALSNLVKQFARPLDFLRELVQNSIDAGTPRIEIAMDYERPDPSKEGVLVIEVRDFGEGMNEGIIDDQLTRLFSSTKENDLTKIGKFGIGFTSIFAIGPDAVLLRTGREGEYWEVLFHRDRSFEKTRITDPIVGTQILLYRAMPESQVAAFIADAHRVLAYWCQHSDVPILWWDKTQQAEATEVDLADPLAAFAEPSAGDFAAQTTGPQPVNRPLDLDGDVVIHHTADGTQAVLAYQHQPSYGFYNGGLTLLQTTSTDALGPYQERMGHISFKLKNDRLEHTLTRDNVIQDDHWDAAMRLIGEAHTDLHRALVDALAQGLLAGDSVTHLQRHLIHDLRQAPNPDWASALQKHLLFADLTGKPRTALAATQQANALGFCVVGEPDCVIAAALAQDMPLFCLKDSPTVRELVGLLNMSRLGFGLRATRFMTAREAFCLPEVLDTATLPESEQRLLAATEAALAKAMGFRMGLPFTDRTVRYEAGPSSPLSRLTLRLGDFGGRLGHSDTLCLNGPSNDDGKRLFFRPRPSWLPWPAIFNHRTLLVNRLHPLYRAQVHASSTDLTLAATGLALALLQAEDIEPERTFRFMVSALAEEVAP